MLFIYMGAHSTRAAAAASSTPACESKNIRKVKKAHYICICHNNITGRVKRFIIISYIQKAHLLGPLPRLPIRPLDPLRYKTQNITKWFIYDLV